jgi:nucleotide-binding universal stress UspA family protein
MYRRILLPLDGSALAEEALPYAITQAERFGAQLILLRVLEPLPQVPGLSKSAITQVKEMTGAVAREYLEGIAAGVREHGVPVQVVTLDGYPHVEIVRYAKQNQVDLIVICTRGQSGLSRWLTGSVADRVARGAGVPVLVVRTSQEMTT